MAASVADRNSGSGLTNPQAALFAAVALAPTTTPSADRITRIADKYLEWLDSHE